MRDEQEEIELLSCPFCGGQADWADGEQKQYGNEQVFCTRCFAVTPPEPTKADAAAWWNARPSNPVAVSYEEKIASGIEELERRLTVRRPNGR